MSDNPFAEPEDFDRTVIRPMPGGNRGAARPAPPQAPAARPQPPQANHTQADATQIQPARAAPRLPAPPPPTSPPAEPAAVAPGADLATLASAQANPLAAAAAPLLQLLARLRNTASPPDQEGMRERTAREVRAFERRARELGVPMEQLRPAHFLLCASLDDVVLNTPWGANGSWRKQPLVATFHNDARGPEGFFEHLRQLRGNPGPLLPVIELAYLCLSLGFMGPYRAVPDGAARIERIREQTYEMIAGERAKAVPELSPRWAGVVAPLRVRRSRFPVWVAGCAALAVLAGGFVWVLTGLSAGSDEVYARMLSAPPAAMPQLVRAPLIQPPPPPPEPPPPGAAERLRGVLSADVSARAVGVVGTPSLTILRLPAKALFAAGSATLLPAAKPLLERIGAALKAEPGPARIQGYTDNQHARTVQFPSPFALSNARAAAVRTVLAQAVGDAARLSSEGRADADPVAPNTTAEGREANQRIDIVLQRRD